VVEVRCVDESFGLDKVSFGLSYWNGMQDLLGDELAHLWIAVTEGIDSNASREVQISAVLDIPEVATLAFDKHGRGSGVGLHHVWRMFADKSSGC
jgi:hypothetical protein